MPNADPSHSAVTRVPAGLPFETAAHFQRRLSVEVDPADVAAALGSGTPDFVLVDCRARGAYRKAHLPAAISLPYGGINAERAAELPEGLLVTSYWGPACNAATKGAALLAAHGRSVKEMIGGVEYWIREDHPTEGARPVVRGEETPADWGLTA